MYGLGTLTDGNYQVVTDPVTGAVRVVTSTPITTETVYASGAPSVYTDASGVPLPAQTQSLSQWLNQNSTTVAVGAVALLAFIVIVKAGGR